MKRCGNKGCRAEYRREGKIDIMECVKCGLSIQHRIVFANGKEISDGKSLLQDWDRAVEVRRGELESRPIIRMCKYAEND